MIRNKNFWAIGSPLMTIVLCITTFAQSAGVSMLDSMLDKTCQPCEDFYKYANGGWLADKNNQIPAAYSSWGKANILADNNSTALRQIVEEAAKNRVAPKGSPQNLNSNQVL